ncbi:MAG TPA: class II fructose-bisphosphatase [Thermotogota bacterium]|nr:class II fructose-bisphosphatase [Thermotogota bacterium]HRW91940.1 class II fructose-bisphosphatase [Thermotogota bacterium]
MIKESYPELSLDLVRVTESAALMSSMYLGYGDKEAVDGAAVDAMRGMLDYIDICGTVVIGEGEKDEAPMLFTGEKVGSWQQGMPQVDIAVDPVDGTRLVAYGLANAIAVMVAAQPGTIAPLPTFYALKMAVGPDLKGKLDVNAPLRENIRVAAAALGVPVGEITVVILQRERHRAMIEEIRKIGARTRLISDGDIAGAIATATPGSGVDICFGVGGSPEAILAAAALRTLGGEMQLKLWPLDEKEKQKCVEGGWDLERVFRTQELVGGDHVVFAATGITDGDFLKGVKFVKGKAVTESLAMRSSSATVRKIITTHDLSRKTIRLKSLDGDEKLVDIEKKRS